MDASGHADTGAQLTTGCACNMNGRAACPSLTGDIDECVAASGNQLDKVASRSGKCKNAVNRILALALVGMPDGEIRIAVEAVVCDGRARFHPGVEHDGAAVVSRWRGGRYSDRLAIDF